MKISFDCKKISLIWVTVIFNVLNWAHANESIVVDEEFYKGGHPPIIREREPGSLELYISPTNINGISYNRFKKIDTQGLKKLFVINSTESEKIFGVSGWFDENNNLEHSLSKPQEASKIVIEVTDKDPLGYMTLESLITIIGKEAQISIYVDPGSVDDRLKISKLSIIGDAISIDEDFYIEKNAHPPVLIEKAPGYFELHIVPANNFGESLNKFKKFDTSRINGLFLINSLEPKSSKNFQFEFNLNKNLEYSLVEGLAANTIRIEIRNDNPSVGTFLHGLMQVVGKESIVELISDQGVSIDNAFFSGIKSLRIGSLDPIDYNACSLFPCARNIRVGTSGMHANSSVTFNSKHITIDGPIYIPERRLFFDSQGTCIFSTNGRIEQLGGLNALCRESFVNHGNIKIQGLANIETAKFINEALWYWENWTQEMKDALPDEIKRSFMIIDEHQHIPFDDIEGRKYEKMYDGSGIISAYNYIINVTQGGFQNRNGAQMHATAPNHEYSQIVSIDEILNIHKQAINQAGYLKKGSKFVPSIINFRGETTLYSHAGRIKNDGSTINIHGNCNVRAGTDIINTDAKASYVDTLYCKIHNKNLKTVPLSIAKFTKTPGCTMPGKGNQCIYVGKLEGLKENLATTSSTGIFLVQDGKSSREALRNIHNIGSIFYAEKGSSDKVGGKYILESRTIDPVSRQETEARLARHISGGDGAVVKLTDAALNPSTNNRPFESIGIDYTKGKSNLTTELGFENKGGIHASEKGTNIISNGPVKLEGVSQIYIAQESHGKNHHMVIHDVVPQPAIIISKGPINVEAPNANFHLHGGIVKSSKGIEICAKNILIEPFITKIEDSYWSRENNFLGSKTTSVKTGASKVINSGIDAGEKVTLNADTLSLSGGIIRGVQGVEIDVDILRLKAQLIDHYRITDTKSKGFFFPGLGNIILDLAKGDFSSKSISNNIGIVATIDRLLNAESISDMAPSILAAAEAYTMADGFSRTYDATGSEMAAMTSTVLDQLQFTTVGGIPVPSSVGHGETKTHRESKWQEAVLPIIGGGNVTIKAREAHVDGAQFNAEKDFNLTVTENLYLHGQPVTASESFRQDGKSVTFSFSNSGVSVSGNMQNAKANSHMIQQILPEIIAGNSVNIDISGNAEVEGFINAPKIRVKVKGELLVKTVQDTGEGTSSQKSINGGVSVSSAGVMPTGGFRFGDGDWFRNWGNQQAGIVGTDVEIDVKTLILEGARIIGKLGHVNAETLEYQNLVNTYESDFSEFGVDTNFLNFLMDPANAPRVLSAANAIKGMAVLGNSDESASQTLVATISQNLNVNTNSNIDNLNRDDSKAQGPVHKSSHKFSLALPVMDLNELGQGLERIGMTAKDIYQKMQGTFENAKQQATAPEEKANIKEIQTQYNDIVEKIEKSNFPEEKKLEIAMRISWLFSETEPDSGQYIIQEKPVSELSEKGKFTPIRLGNDDQWDFTYSPNGGAILAVEISVSYGEDTYKYMAQYFDTATINDVRQIQSKWNRIMKDFGPGAIDFCEGFVMAPVETLLAVKNGFVLIGGLYIDIADGTFAKDSEAFRSLEWENQLKIIDHVAAEMLQGMYEGVRESLASPKGWGGFVGDMAMGAGALRSGKVGTSANVAGRLNKKLRPKEVGVLDKSDVKPHADGGNLGKKADSNLGNSAPKIDIQIVKAGTEIGNGFKHHIDIDANLLKKEANFQDIQVQAKFEKHSGHFGIQGNYNKQNRELFKQKMIEHINDSDTIAIAGQYTRGKIQDVVHYYNPKTELNIMKDKNGDFISGWKLSKSQQKFLEETGKIGGDR